MESPTGTTTTEEEYEAILHLASIGDWESLDNSYDVSSIARAKDRHGSTPLHYAAGNGHCKVCSYLLTQNLVSIDVVSQNNGRTALHWAARNGFADVCRMLVNDFRAEVDVEGKGEVTPLQLAVWQCHIETSKVLVVELGANPGFINAWGCSVAHWIGKCPLYTNQDGRRRQQQENQPITQQEQEQLQLHRQQRLVECCDWLFQDCRIPYTVPNHHGQTPLHKAAFAGNLPVAQYLVERLGMLDDTRDRHGNNAAECAERGNHGETANWLRRHASPILVTAMRHLGIPRHNSINNNNNNNPLPPPPPQELRTIFLSLAKICHPDRSSSSSSGSNNDSSQRWERWNSVRDSYRLLMDWWLAPEQCNLWIKFHTRNAVLTEHKQLLWHAHWHSERSKPFAITTNITTTKTNRNEMNQRPLESCLMEFERRLVSLLRTEGFRIHGLPISQLPKEYEKNWHTPVPKPRDFGCRKLIYLVQKHCPNVSVEYGKGKQQALLRVACDERAETARCEVQ